MTADRQIFLLQVQARPYQLCPDIISDHAWVWCELGTYGLRNAKATHRIERPSNPSPFLTITKKTTYRRQVPSLCGRTKRLPTLLSGDSRMVGPVSNTHTINQCDVLYRQFLIPVRR